MKMERVTKQQDEAEKTLGFLKQQLEILKQLAVQKQKEAEQIEIAKLGTENNVIQTEINNLKHELVFFQSQNGVKQVPLPKRVKTLGESTPIVSSSTTSIVPQATTTTNNEPKKENQKENKKANKKEKKSGDAGKTKPTGGKGDENKPVDVSRINMRVGKIIDVKKHPDADSLYVETVEVRESKPRTIISGLVKHITLEQMQDRMAVFMLNLKPAKMRGILSEGMIMCASTPEKVEILEVPTGAAVGDQVVCQLFPGEPDIQLNPKRKIWEQVAPDMRVNSKGEPGYKGSVMTIPGKGDCKAPTMKDCPIK